MTVSYSIRTKETNDTANASEPGVQLGRFCISTGIPASEVSVYFKVSKQTVYSWFSGVHSMDEKRTHLVRSFIDAHTENQK